MSNTELIYELHIETKYEFVKCEKAINFVRNKFDEENAGYKNSPSYVWLISEAKKILIQNL